MLTMGENREWVRFASALVPNKEENKNMVQPSI